MLLINVSIGLGGTMPRTKNKFKAVRHEFNGHTFASGREKRRYQQLLLLERAGKIKNLEPHPKYEIIPKQIKSNGRTERVAVYTADFRYIEDGALVVEDVKSKATAKLADYVLRRKLMLQVHGIEIKETY